MCFSSRDTEIYLSQNTSVTSCSFCCWSFPGQTNYYAKSGIFDYRFFIAVCVQWYSESQCRLMPTNKGRFENFNLARKVKSITSNHTAFSNLQRTDTYNTPHTLKIFAECLDIKVIKHLVTKFWWLCIPRWQYELVKKQLPINPWYRML